MNMQKIIYLIDGFSLIFRAYYAMIRTPLRNNGMNTSAIYGFFQTLFSCFQQYRPEYLAIMFDSPGKTFRHDLYKEYKGNRQETPEDLKEQIPHIINLVDTLGVKIFRQTSYEADDIIFSATRKLPQDFAYRVITADKDLAQVVTPNVRLLRFSQGKLEEMGADEVRDQWGVSPSQMQDYLALVGDSADNISGVKGIGKVGAGKLLKEFGSLSEIYERIDQVTPLSVKKKLSEGKGDAFLSYELVKLRDDVPLDFHVEELRLGQLDFLRLRDSLAEMGIKRLFSEYSFLQETSLSEPEAKQGSTLFRSDGYELVSSEEELQKWVEKIEKAEIFAFDLESTHTDPMQAEPVGVSFSTEKGRGCYIPLRGPDGEVLEEEMVRNYVRRLVDNPSLKMVGQNIKYDMKVLFRWNLRSTRSLFFDTMVAAWMLNSSLHNFGMDHLAERYLSYQTIHFSDLTQGIPGTPKKFTFDQVPLPLATQYAVEDVDITLQLYHLLSRQLEEENLQTLFYEVEMPLLKLLSRMELKGMKADPDALIAQSKELDIRRKELEQEIYQTCGHAFNIQSPLQLQQVLFIERGLKPLKKTKTGFSTDIDVLEELALKDEIPALVLAYRLLSKLKSTYLDALVPLIHAQTGRIHTHFQQTVAATGRLSSKDPNLQNIPIKGEEGRKIRDAFLPEKGWIYVGADYSQIELVVLAHFSKDLELCYAFQNDIDIHARTASLIFSSDIETINDEQRRIAKTINFGVMYGMSPFSLSRQLRIPLNEARAFIQKYFEQYAQVKNYTENLLVQARKDHSVRTVLGRKRPLPNIASKNFSLRSAEERIAVNTVIQGSAADIIKKAMLEVDRKLENMEAELVLQVHDELVVECPEEEGEKVKHVLAQTMTKTVSLRVPLTVNVMMGSCWGALH